MQWNCWYSMFVTCVRETVRVLTVTQDWRNMPFVLDAAKVGSGIWIPGGSIYLHTGLMSTKLSLNRHELAYENALNDNNATGGNTLSR